MFNLLVTGANGQLGNELQLLSNNYPNAVFYFSVYEELDITNHQSVRQFVLQNKINALLNCAAYTAVDKAETEITSNEEINYLAVENFAKLAKELGIKFIHISTDYVFDGTHFAPYTETAKTNPQNVYGKTKLAGELALLKENPANSIIIRTSWVYSSFGANFVKTMLRLGKERSELNVIFDQVGTPTYAKDLAKVLLQILPQLSNNTVEIYHYSNEGVCSWYDFAKAIFEHEKITCKVLPIETIQYPTPAKRPSYSVLNKKKIKETFEIEIPYWRDALHDCLIQLSQNKGV